MHIALIMVDDFSMWLFRKGLIRGLVERGAEVVVITPDGPYVPLLRDLGARHVPVPMQRFVTPGRDLLLFLELYRVLKRLRPDIVHTMTVKPNIYGTLAARLAGIPRTVGLVSGLGYPFSRNRSRRVRIIRFIVSRMCRFAFRFSERVWCQNREDMEQIIAEGILRRRQALLIRGGGINLREFAPGVVPPEALDRLRREFGYGPDDPVVVLVLARMISTKGVREFVEASRILAERHPRARFLLAGPSEPTSPDAVPESELRAAEGPNFRWTGFRRDIREITALADVVTLPSCYREGIPRSLLEGLALGKPVVTTDNVGCRETVEDGRNGFLVPVRNAKALADAIGRLLSNPGLRRSFGERSRRKAEAEFDEDPIVDRVWRELYRLPPVPIRTDR